MVDSEDEAPSVFANYLERGGELRSVTPQGHTRSTELDLPRMVGKLRFATVDGELNDDQRAGAARLLAVLARSGVRGANPDDWVGASQLTSSTAVIPLDRLSLSPSALQDASDCMLQWYFRRIKGEDARNLNGEFDLDALEVGNLVHHLAETYPSGGAEELKAALDEYWQENELDDGTWWREKKYQEIVAMLERLGTSQQSRDSVAAVQVEQDIRVKLSEATVRGRADRIETIVSEDGDKKTLRIIDIKTGKTAPSARQLDENLQLRAYQLALQSPDVEVEAALLTVAAPKARNVILREQEPMDGEESAAMVKELDQLAQRMVGPSYQPTVGARCETCSFARVCPARPEGNRRFE